ncbi:hypothetical protein [Bradyrhizobium diazoefficiens]|uniref:hypothetical protein n=1 Tax=Bradyrhizobium diazoefficiens TaxID=1355477 RepID=UPI001B78BDF6|nr:uncharacterized protein YlzI (FlbEa/FlbD family) [Bradyrhizobium japonicum]
MISVTSITGQQVDIDEHHIAVVNGPYPNDNGPHTYIYTAPLSVLVTKEAADKLVARIPKGPFFAQLTRPDGTPIWINAQYVTRVRPPLWTENTPQGNVHAVVMVASTLHHAVIEDVPTVLKLLNVAAV